MPGKFLTANWNNLIMANYVIDPGLLRPYLPFKTEPDTYNGNAYVSLVGFMFSNTRVLGVKVPFHVDFEEVNLRFYVRYNDQGNWKRGAVFIKETVPKPAISFIANTLYHEKYCTRRMKHFYGESAEEIHLGYQWKQQDKWNRMEATVKNKALPMLPGSEEEFIAEHYWGYSRYDALTTFEYAVEHPAWEVFPLKDYLIDCDFTRSYGEAFSVLQDSIPHSVFVAKGSAVTVLKKRKL